VRVEREPPSISAPALVSSIHHLLSVRVEHELPSISAPALVSSIRRFSSPYHGSRVVGPLGHG
jgi:hypothetical protein